jgi:hypothetical protein
MPLAAHQYTGRYMTAKPKAANSHDRLTLSPSALPSGGAGRTLLT